MAHGGQAPCSQTPGENRGAAFQSKRVLALGLGFFFVLLGFVGAALPLIPSTPFFLCATACFASSSPRLEAWLMSFSFVSGPVSAWRQRGAIARPAKIMASAGMSASLAAYALSGASAWNLTCGAGLMGLCAIFIWTRPS